MATIEDGIIIGWGIVVTQVDTSLIHTIDVPSLSIVLTHTFPGIVANPCCCIVVGEIEKVCKTFFATDKTENGSTCIVAQSIIQVIDIVGNVNDTIGFVYDSAVKTAVANNGVDQIICSCRSKVHSHSIEVIYIIFQILLTEVSSDFREVVKNGFPISITQFG